MGTSLVLRRNSHNEKCTLVLRSHDLGETDYHHLATLTMEQGQGLTLGPQPVSWLYDKPVRTDVDPGEIRIHLRRDAEADQAMWDLQFVREKGSDRICYVNDDVVGMLMTELGKDAFEDCDADMREHGRMKKRFRIENLRAEADALEAELEEAIAADMPALG